jgi:carboxypeptidase C (cathepsin A)
MSRSLCLVPVLLVAVAVLGAAQEAKPAKGDAGKESVVRTQHTITLGGEKIEYEATAGTLPLKSEDDKLKANVFYVAYTRKGGGATRPITFAFNGGPGSSSVWLHMGLLGPRRVDLGKGGPALAPPYQLVTNDASPLDLTDLVFVDPVTTGYSRATTGEEAKQFHGVTQDVQSVGEFIRLYVTRNRRWDSPKFLVGESYGTTRAAGLAEHLQDHLGMNLNGIVLVSSVLNFQTIRFDEGNDLPYSLFLPSYTATAWYHKKLAPDLLADRHKVLAEAEKFASTDYLLALQKGSALTDQERHETARKLAHLTGLSEEYVLRSNLRIDAHRFRKELLRGSRQTVGRYDSRFTGADLDAAGEGPEYDPSYAAVQGPYTALVQEYLSKDLNYERDMPYRILTARVQPWDFGNAKNRYLNVAPALRRAMTQNPALRVLVASGYYDLATPYFATEYTFQHLGMESGLLDRVTQTYFDAGHMMYIDHASLERLKKDLHGFLSKSLDHPRPVPKEQGGR